MTVIRGAKGHCGYPPAKAAAPGSIGGRVDRRDDQQPDRHLRVASPGGGRHLAGILGGCGLDLRANANETLGYAYVR